MRVLQLSEPLILNLLKQPRFYANVPEFRALEAFASGTRSVKSGCCGTRVEKAPNRLPDFVRIVGSLNADGLKRLKEFVGADHLQYHTNRELKQI